MSDCASMCVSSLPGLLRPGLFAACLLALLPVQLAAAHDVWLSPSAGVATVGDTVNVSLLIAEAGTTEVIGFTPERVERLWVRGAAGERAIALRGPVASIPVSSDVEGTLAVGFRSKPALSELDSAKFDAYLREEHLVQVIAAREKAPGTQAVREHYSRSLKSLVRVGEAALVDCAIGLPMELTIVRADDAGLVVRATFEGEPLAGVWVDRADARGVVAEERATDAGGVARFAAWRGEWIVRATHMQASREAGVDWRSWWATTVFVWDGARIEACG